jgi:hypothetical protein
LLRGYVNEPEGTVCPQLKAVLLQMGADRMVVCLFFFLTIVQVGHTPQQSGMILSRCNMALVKGGPIEPRIYDIDLAISAAYGSLAQGMMEIERDGETGVVWVKGVYFSGSRLLNGKV